jgi:hypothetical protein
VCSRRRRCGAGHWLAPVAVWLLALGLTACQPPPGLRATVYSIGWADEAGLVAEALDWLGLAGTARDALAAELGSPSSAVVELMIENEAAEPRVLSEPHLRPALQLADGRTYRGILRTAGSPAMPVPPGLGVRAIVYGQLPPEARPSRLVFEGANINPSVPAEASPARSGAAPLLSGWSRAEARPLGSSFQIADGQVVVWAERVDWPDVVLAVRNDGPRRFPIYADHMLHAALVGPDGTLLPLEPLSVDPLTLGVRSGELAHYVFRGPPASQSPADATLMVAVYKDLKSEGDLQGLAVYALERTASAPSGTR